MGEDTGSARQTRSQSWPVTERAGGWEQPLVERARDLHLGDSRFPSEFRKHSVRGLRVSSQMDCTLWPSSPAPRRGLSPRSDAAGGNVAGTEPLACFVGTVTVSAEKWPLWTQLRALRLHPRLCPHATPAPARVRGENPVGPRACEVIRPRVLLRGGGICRLLEGCPCRSRVPDARRG